MHSRRKFLLQGAMATAAVLASKPLTTIGQVASSFTGLTGKRNRLFILHTTAGSESGKAVLPILHKINKNNDHAILVKAGPNSTKDNVDIVYDAAVRGTNTGADISGGYKIIHTGKYKTGVIAAIPGDPDIVNTVNSLSAFLKKEKNCNLVVCLSQLGYKNRKSIDDQGLAKKATHLDIIIGGHEKNCHQKPCIVLNQAGEEVVIHTASANSAGLICIDFDGKGRKKMISFTDPSSVQA
jgi:hypothetical protein